MTPNHNGRGRRFGGDLLRNLRVTMVLKGLPHVSFSVPQKSVLGPLLLIFCINDLPKEVQATTFQYVDDATFFNHSDNLTTQEKNSFIVYYRLNNSINSNFVLALQVHHRL